MNRLKLICTALLLMLALQSQAKLIIETCIQDHVENTNCFKVQVSIIEDNPDLGRVLIAQGSTWVGSDCAKNGHNAIPNPKPGCAIAQLNGNDIYTDINSPDCIGDYLGNPNNAAACQASIDELLSHAGTGNKGSIMPTGKLTIYPNPANSYIIVGTAYEEAAGTTLFYLYDMTGKEVFSTHLQNPGRGKFTLSLKDIAPGIYNAVVKSGKTVMGSKKITVQ